MTVTILEQYRTMYLIRRFEETLFELFSAGKVFGTTHAYIGQEAIATSVMSHLIPEDIVFSNHRCHGHYLARTGDSEGLFGELMGKVGGVCGGRGGSQHLCNNGFYSNGILGSTVPVAAGMAFAEKRKGSGGIGVLFIGDGAFGEGTIYETFNMISLWDVPLLVVVENNRWAQTTPVELNFAGSFVERASAFGISATELESGDVMELTHRFSEVVRQVRETSRPHVEIIHTYRLAPHSKGDDTRPEEEIAVWRAKDPLKKAAAQLDSHDSMARAQLEKEVEEELKVALKAAEAMGFPTSYLNSQS